MCKWKWKICLQRPQNLWMGSAVDSAKNRPLSCLFVLPVFHDYNCDIIRIWKRSELEREIWLLWIHFWVVIKCIYCFFSQDFWINSLLQLYKCGHIQEKIWLLVRKSGIFLSSYLMFLCPCCHFWALSWIFDEQIGDGLAYFLRCFALLYHAVFDRRKSDGMGVQKGSKICPSGNLTVSLDA